MGIYYKCLRGDSEHFALMEPDAVAVQDALGRNWICHPIEAGKVETLTMAEHVSDVFAADATARRHGIGQQGTEIRIYYCEDESELLEKLLLDTMPREEG